MNLHWIRSVRVALLAALLAVAGCAGQKESTGEFIDDAALTARVKAGFVADSKVSALDITVHSDKGVVSLGGVVRTSEEMWQAERIARRTPGVRQVRTDIVVR